jgi:divinyl chlorophyllide a 8-vinyl-reductase
VERGHRVTALVRPKPGRGDDPGELGLPAEVTVRPGRAGDADDMRRVLAAQRTDAGLAEPDAALAPEERHRGPDVEPGAAPARIDAVVSCMASRTGAPRDAWAVDHDAHLVVLRAAQEAGIEHFVLLSAICVQKPRLAFQRAKLAFEEALRASGMRFSIVRPTAFFKSVSGQLERVRQGKPFLVFGDGTLTPCTPIGDDDLADFIAGCLTEEERCDAVLPIGGPGPALTPLDQGRLLAEALGVEPRYRHVPVGLLDAIVGTLSLLGRLIPALREKAELARIGRYYATEAMLVHDPDTGEPRRDLTPSHGSETLGEYYRRLARGEVPDDRGEHALF